MHGGATSAPPPTPSAHQPENNLISTSAAADSLSRMMMLHHLLPPTLLSLPTRRRSQPATATCPPHLPTFSLPDARLNPSLLLSAKHGFFQLTQVHCCSAQLADSAESEALSLFNLPREKKDTCLPRNWPVGFEEGDEVLVDDDDDVDGLLGDSFCLDESCYVAELGLSSLREFSRGLEKLGLEIVELLCRSVGFENPLGRGDPSPTRFSSMMWVTEGLAGKNNKTPVAGRFYPYVVGLQYQIRSGQKYSMLSDSGWVSVELQVESVLVTIGDIAQVWSNGELNKVRGRPVKCLGEDEKKSRCISMSLLVTLPIDTRICPLLPIPAGSGSAHDDEDENDRSVDGLGDHQINDNSGSENRESERRLFKSFCLEDYAWRLYNERLHFKDPLDRFRIKN